MSETQTEWTTFAPGARRRVTVDGEKLMVVEVVLDKGAVVAQHSHPHEQASYIVSGQVDYTVSGKTSRHKAGNSIFLPSNEPHGVTAIEESMVLDVFSPPREDFRKA